MKLILQRKDFRYDGIFSEILDENYHFLFVALEHAYLCTDGTYKPKIPNGTYTCVRGMHNLESRIAKGEPPFETFEITGVDGHSGLLFHPLNYNEESDGCVGPGLSLGKRTNGGQMICNSQKAFDALINLQVYNQTFDLLVE